MSESQSAKVLEICNEIKATQDRLDEHRRQLLWELRELFGCGPRMPLEEQKRVLAGLFFDLGKKTDGRL
jgi:hypothetical protein